MRYVLLFVAIWFMKKYYSNQSNVYKDMIGQLFDTNHINDLLTDRFSEIIIDQAETVSVIRRGKIIPDREWDLVHQHQLKHDFVAHIMIVLSTVPTVRYKVTVVLGFKQKLAYAACKDSSLPSLHEFRSPPESFNFRT